jgi:hypothetical protein
MDAAQFCGEYAHENKNGRIRFTKRIVDKFIVTYTNLSPDDFTKEMRERLIIGVMVDLYNKGVEGLQHEPDYPAEKIDLPKFIFQ